MLTDILYYVGQYAASIFYNFAQTMQGDEWMRVVGVVAEYNPFHAGHRFHLEQTRRQAGECAVLAVMSGNFVQRGDCAIADKWTRTRAALEGGVDLVLELPTVWAVSSAEGFARGAVALMESTGMVDMLSFGSECGEADQLQQIALCLDSPAYRDRLRQFLDRGMPFAACRQAAVRELAGEETAGLLSCPNNNLGVEYIRALNALGSAIRPMTVQRVGAAHDGGGHPEFPSASFLRSKILSVDDLEGNPAALRFNERGVLTILRAMDEADFAALPDCGEGLSHRLYRAARQGRTLEEVYALAKTKRYAHARIRRAVLWAALGLRAECRPDVPACLRMLGANERGRAVLHEMKKRAILPVITKPAHGKGLPLLELEARCTDFYALCRKTAGPCGTEWTTGPVMI